MRNLLPILDNGAGHLVGVIGFGPVASDGDCQVLGRVFASDFLVEIIGKVVAAAGSVSVNHGCSFASSGGFDFERIRCRGCGTAGGCGGGVIAAG